jgi:uncharacterized membrane protein
MNASKITPTPQSLFADLDLELPALDLSEPVAAHSNDTQSIKKLKKPQAHTHKTQPAPSAAALAGQAFLPGLSRRGRPRLQTPISAVERTAEHRRKRLEAGAKRLEMILDRDVSSALDALAEHFKEPRSEVISTLILKASSRLLKR